MMKGLELCRAYYETYGRPMLEKEFSQVLAFAAVGLFGSGSECFGFDDEVSADHDFEPCFCVLLPGEDIVDRRTAFLLERAYAKLPAEFEGFKRERMLPVGGARHGILRTAEVFQAKTGTPDGNLTPLQWLRLPGQYLAEATNGEIFHDEYGEVTRIRQNLARYPEDIRLKKLAGHLLLMAQAGQYNYMRCIRHGETAAAQLSVYEFVKSAMEAAFLLNNRYQPFYKWGFKAMRELDTLADLADDFEFLISTGNNAEQIQEKEQLLENITARFAAALKEQNLTEADGAELERHAWIVNNRIKNPLIRNMNILDGV